MRKNLSLSLLLACMALLILYQMLIGNKTGLLAPHSLLAGAEGESWMYAPLVQNDAGAQIPTLTPTPTVTATPSGTPPASEGVLVGAGDIAVCGEPYDEATADLLDGIPGTVFTAGDNAYPSGTLQQFEDCYDPSWGRHKARTRPSPGNHDYATEGAAGYFEYFGEAAGDPDKGYYSYDLALWHIVVLNSNCQRIDGDCAAGSPQETWLRQDLAANPRLCTLAYFHHPLFSSGIHGGTDHAADLWQALYDFGADVVVSGHDHIYERFAPQDPDGNHDPQNGIRQFIVGTGGRMLYNVGDPAPNSEVIENETFGVLKLLLHPAAYEWEFIPIAGQTFSDLGVDNCH